MNGRPSLFANRTSWRVAWHLGIAAALASSTAMGQPNAPHIGYAYPAGGCIGTTFEIRVGGQFLEGVTNAYITGSGVTAVVTDFHRPMPQGQFNNLRDRMQELRDKRQAARRGPGTNVWTTADEAELNSIRDRVLRNPPNRNAIPALADVATVRIILTNTAPPGDREIRLATALGLSNPIKFVVGTLPEFTAPVAHSENADEDRLRRMFLMPPVAPPATNPAAVRLPVVINGQIMPGERDHYRFPARKGDSLVVVVSARDLIPYLADAVPGWFQATVALYDAKGREVAYDDDFRFDPDPVLHFLVPADGEYVLEIKDSIFRGRDDFVYRIAIGELPFVTSAFPLGTRVGHPTMIALEGWNLATNRIEFAPTKPGVSRIGVAFGGSNANDVTLAADELEEILERGPSPDLHRARKIRLPVVINGRIAAPGAAAVFQFQGQAGQAVVAEVLARRLGSPLDSALLLMDAQGGRIAFSDDRDDPGSGLNTHHADSYLAASLPADGTYFLRLTDTQNQGGPPFGYRLRVSAPRPDFALRVMPASLAIRPGGSAALRVVALRQDGFTNDINVMLLDPPPGFKLSGGRIPAGSNEVKLTLSAPNEPLASPRSLKLEGRAVQDGVALLHEAVPADDEMQAFFYRHLVPAQELQVAVLGRSLPRAGVRVLGKGPVKLPQGGLARVEVGLPMARFMDKLHFELSDAPEGVSIQKFVQGRDGAELWFASGPTARVGMKGNLIVDVFNAKAEPARDRNKVRRAPVTTIPAISFEIVAAE